LETADLIKKIVAAHNLSQTELAEKIGVERSQVTRYLNGEREPAPLTCLFLAALSVSDAEQYFWISKCGLTHEQMRLLGLTLGLPAPNLLSGEEHQLLDWWRNPATQMEKRVFELVAQLLLDRPIRSVNESSGNTAAADSGVTDLARRTDDSVQFATEVEKGNRTTTKRRA
jgi:transcriptional regulator with XRE-family HTH domain